MKNFDFIKNFKNKIKELYNTNKKVFFACVALVVVLFIMIISVIVSPKNSNSKTETSVSSVSITDYATGIENKLKNIILCLDSVSDVSVFVMVDSTPTIKYLTEVSTQTQASGENSTSTISETVVFEKNGSVSTPVVVTTIMPKVTGVLIVTNKINAVTKLSIISSVSVVLNIDESCICLLQER